MGWHFPLQGIFLTQKLNLCLLNWQVNSLLLSHEGSIRFISEEKKLLTQNECILNFTLYCQIALQSGCINLYPDNSAYSTPSSLTVLSNFLKLTSAMNVKWHLIIVSSDIYLVTAEVEHPFKHLLTVFVSSFPNCLFKVIANFSTICFPWVSGVIYIFGYLTTKTNIHCIYPCSGWGLSFNFFLIVTFIDPKF